MMGHYFEVLIAKWHLSYGLSAWIKIVVDKYLSLPAAHIHTHKHTYTVIRVCCVVVCLAWREGHRMFILPFTVSLFSYGAFFRGSLVPILFLRDVCVCVSVHIVGAGGNDELWNKASRLCCLSKLLRNGVHLAFRLHFFFCTIPLDIPFLWENGTTFGEWRAVNLPIGWLSTAGCCPGGL